VIEVKPISDNRHRVYGLDLLRTLAITSVILFHYPTSGLLTVPIRHYGWIGVDLFFVLSGYLIGGQLFDQMVKHGEFSLKLF
jgi:peptidoglycan/LPS O-acetylase OafA/YrhL